MKSKKWFAMFVVIAMVCMLLPMTAFATEAKPGSIDITVNGYGIDQPIAGADITTTTEGITITPIKDWMSWIDGKYSNASGNFERGIRYCHYVKLEAQDGYTLPDISEDTLTINGKAPEPGFLFVEEKAEDGSQMIFFFTEELVEKTDNTFTLTVSNYAVGNTWDDSNVSASSDKIQVGTAHLVYDKVIGDHDVSVTEPLEAHTAYRFYFYISTNAGYIFDVDYLVANKENVSILVDGQTVTPWRIGDGGTDGKSIVMDIDAPMLHNYGAYQYDESGHWQECQDANCPDKEGSIRHSTASHRFGDWTEVQAPTETEEGMQERVCVCGYKKSSVIPVLVEHGKIEIINAKPATCTQAGNIAYWYCAGCGKYFSDEACSNEIVLNDTVIAAKGHGETEIKNVKDATCTEEGYTGDKVCKDCGEVVEQGKAIAKVAHTYKDGKCTVCGAADPDYRPNEGNPDSPQTGDNSNMGLWFVLMAAAGIGLAGAAVYGRKKHLQK